jgi:uncharacterized protein (DUF2235 family)
MSTTNTYHPDLGQFKKTTRNFVINIDGTNNDLSQATVTNVAKFHRSIDDSGKSQHSLYFPGVGTPETNQGFVSELLGKGLGVGVRQIRDTAYVKFVEQYRPGDRLFIIGFSRGAAVARMLANLIHEHGIPGSITVTRDNRRRVTDFENRGRKTSVEIEMLGVWDTVGATGIPVDLFGIPFQKVDLFADLNVTPNVKKAVHLVSVDENRDAFIPSLMNYEPDRIEEVWFPGVHSDVGGGYDTHRLGDITLEFMIDRARRAGLAFDDEALSEIVPNPDGLGVIHRHSDRPLDFKLSPRKIKVVQNGKRNKTLPAQLHESIFNRMDALGRERYDPPNIKNTKFDVVDRDILD